MLNSEIISKSIISKFDSIGITAFAGGDETQTAKLVRLIVGEIIIAMKRDASVITTVTTVGTAVSQQGTGIGNVT